MAYNIIAQPNHQGFQSLGTIKGTFTPGTESHKGILETAHGTFNAFIHGKCRKKIPVGTEKYFLVWLKYIKKEPRLTVISFGDGGIDNQFFLSAAFVSYKKIVGDKQLKYQLIATRNPEFHQELPEGKKKLKIKINCKGNLPEDYLKKFIAVEAKFVEGVLVIKTYKLLGEEVPDAEFVFQKPAKRQGRKPKKFNKKNVEYDSPKPLIKKKITVGAIREVQPFERPKLKSIV